jgi:ketosteroid isomerase-like protein
MSLQNVELTHQAYDALNRRDLDAFPALMEAGVEARPRVVAIEGGNFSRAEALDAVGLRE